jgi:hypothetical protein
MLKKALFSLTILVLLMASCAAGEASRAVDMETSDVYYGGEEAGGFAPMAPEPADDAATGQNIASSTTEISAERMVIQNADLSIIAEDPAQSMDEIGKMAESMGGFVVESYLYQQTLNSGAQVPYATITVRVPVEKLEEALAQIKAGAVEVESANISGQDVTSQYTDLASRLRNLEAAESQLQEIMDEANRTEDVLDVFNELVSVREQIEVIKGQMKYYEESAALSKISVGITADEAVQPIQLGGWQPAGVAKDAIEAMVQALQILVNAGIWFVLCVLPIGLLIGLPLFFIGRAVVRRRRKNKASEKTADEIIREE